MELIKKGFNINESIQHTYHPLYYSILNDNEKLTEFLIKNGANINFIIEHMDGFDLLDIINKSWVIPYLNLNFQDRNKKTLLMKVLTQIHDDYEESCGEYVVGLINNPSLDINLQDKNGKTALMYACNYAHPFAIESILNRQDSNIHITDNKGNNIVKHASSQKVYDENASALNVLNDFINPYKNPIDFHTTNFKGNNALMEVFKNSYLINSYHQIEFLLENHSGCVKSQNNKGDSALILFSKNLFFHYEALHLGDQYEALNVIEKLIKKSNTLLQNNEGNTALMYACSTDLDFDSSDDEYDDNNAEIENFVISFVRDLIDKDSKILFIKNKAGLTAFDFALNNKNDKNNRLLDNLRAKVQDLITLNQSYINSKLKLIYNDINNFKIILNNLYNEFNLLNNYKSRLEHELIEANQYIKYGFDFSSNRIQGELDFYNGLIYRKKLEIYNIYTQLQESSDLYNNLTYKYNSIEPVYNFYDKQFKALKEKETEIKYLNDFLNNINEKSANKLKENFSSSSQVDIQTFRSNVNEKEGRELS